MPDIQDLDLGKLDSAQSPTDTQPLPQPTPADTQPQYSVASVPVHLAPPPAVAPQVPVVSSVSSPTTSQTEAPAEMPKQPVVPPKMLDSSSQVSVAPPNPPLQPPPAVSSQSSPNAVLAQSPLTPAVSDQSVHVAGQSMQYRPPGVTQPVDNQSAVQSAQSVTQPAAPPAGAAPFAVQAADITANQPLPPQQPQPAFSAPQTAPDTATAYAASTPMLAQPNNQGVSLSPQPPLPARSHGRHSKQHVI